MIVATVETNIKDMLAEQGANFEIEKVNEEVSELKAQVCRWVTPLYQDWFYPWVPQRFMGEGIQ